MQAQGYRETYLAALEVAHSDLDRIYQEYELLQLRKQQLEGALGALEPFLRSVNASSSEFHHAEQTRDEHLQRQPEPELVKPLFHAVPQVPEPAVPAAFAPVSDTVLDPIQHRINCALGLAVA